MERPAKANEGAKLRDEAGPARCDMSESAADGTTSRRSPARGCCGVNGRGI